MGGSVQGFGALSDADLREHARKFLAKYHSDMTIPVPIEEIIEFKLKADIVPIPGLHTLLEIDGFTSSDLKRIFVDERVYNRYNNRYRFTLAHEVGHIVLHKDYYNQCSFRSIHEWMTFQEDLPSDHRIMMEGQANQFAGLILVPPLQLKRSAEKLFEQAAEHGISPVASREAIMAAIPSSIAKHFGVSQQTAKIRLQSDKFS